ncbi:MAG TPA: hypothetical protein VFY54_07750 [Rubrobacter sp.]|nr:hypothetical protein [Rubrobacter sp.]
MGNRGSATPAAHPQTTVGSQARSFYAMLATGLLPAGATLRRGR